MIELPLINSGFKEPNEYLCITAALTIVFALWLKLMFSLGVTIYVFCVVFVDRQSRKLKSCEVPYVIVSLVLPLVVSFIPLATKSYGPAGAWCWIKNWQDNCPSKVYDVGVIQQFALWYGPALAVLVVNSVAVIAITVFLGCRAYYKGGSQYQMAVNQMLPLAAYPVIFCLLLLPTLAGRVYGAIPHAMPLVGFIKADAVCSSAYSLLASITLIVHVLVVKRIQMKTKVVRSYGATETYDGATYKEETKEYVNSCTNYSVSS